jgi:Flp pilus assembly protein CpaB
MMRKPMLVWLSLALVVLVTSGLVIWDRTHRGSTPATAEQTLGVGSTRVVVERPTGTLPVTATSVPLGSLPPYQWDCRMDDFRRPR